MDTLVWVELYIELSHVGEWLYQVGYEVIYIFRDLMST